MYVLPTIAVAIAAPLIYQQLPGESITAAGNRLSRAFSEQNVGEISQFIDQRESLSLALDTRTVNRFLSEEFYSTYPLQKGKWVSRVKPEAQGAFVTFERIDIYDPASQFGFFMVGTPGNYRILSFIGTSIGLVANKTYKGPETGSIRKFISLKTYLDTKMASLKEIGISKVYDSNVNATVALETLHSRAESKIAKLLAKA